MRWSVHTRGFTARELLGSILTEEWEKWKVSAARHVAEFPPEFVTYAKEDLDRAIEGLSPITALRDGSLMHVTIAGQIGPSPDHPDPNAPTTIKRAVSVTVNWF